MSGVWLSRSNNMQLKTYIRRSMFFKDKISPCFDKATTKNIGKIWF